MTDISTSYCTLDEVRNGADLPDDFTDPDGVYARSIQAASRFIDQVTGRRFYPDADSAQARKFWPISSGYCIIDDLNTFTSLADRDGNLWTLDTDFILEPANAAADGQPYTAIRAISRPFLFSRADIPPSSWSILNGRITVTGNYGWASCPDDVRFACMLLTQRYTRRMRDAPLGIYSVGTGEPAIRLARTDPDVYSLLQPYMLSFVV